jgi:hypothetical protein
MSGAKSMCRGWFELLYRLDSAPRVQKLEDLRESLYTHHGGQISTEEFEFTYQVYEFYGEENRQHELDDSLPRPLRHGDCFNLVMKFPDVVKVRTMALLDKKTLQFMPLSYKPKVEIDHNYNIAMVSLKDAFDSVFMPWKN